MWEGPNLYRMLEAEWNRQAHSSSARAACARWARTEPALEGITSPAELVSRCAARGQPETSAALLRAVLRHAGSDQWAARTVLQAVLPGLAAVARRARPLVHPDGPWQGVDELDQFVVTAAYQRIASLAAEPPRRWPASAIVARTWKRVRRFAEQDAQRRARLTRLSAVTEPTSVVPPTPAEELADTLAVAVDAGIVEQRDVLVLFASRALGQPVEALAEHLQRHPRSVWRRRNRAEQLLTGAGPVLVAAAAG